MEITRAISESRECGARYYEFRILVILKGRNPTEKAFVGKTILFDGEYFTSEILVIRIYGELAKGVKYIFLLWQGR